MTTFDERIRALVWAGELLQDLAVDEALPAEMRAHAAKLLDGYPTPESIESRLEDLEDPALLLAAQRIQDVGAMTIRVAKSHQLWSDQARRIARHSPVGTDAPRNVKKPFRRRKMGGVLPRPRARPERLDAGGTG